MAARRPTPSGLVGSVLSTAAALEVVDEDALHRDGWTRLLHGAHAAGVREHEVTQAHRISGVRVREGGFRPVLVGPSAAWAWGARLARPDDPVHVAVDSGVRRQDRLVPHRVRDLPPHVVLPGWGRVTTPTRTCLDLARGVGTTDTGRQWRTAWVDAVLHATTLTAAELRDEVAEARGLHGLARAAPVLAAARDGAESPRETLLRLLVIARGFPEPATQVDVRDAQGAFVARLDLAWPHLRVAVEYDGDQHRERGRWSSDLGRQNRLRAEGWIVLRVDAAGLAAPGAFLRQLALFVPRDGALA